jgi:hypothetical protein
LLTHDLPGAAALEQENTNWAHARSSKLVKAGAVGAKDDVKITMLKISMNVSENDLRKLTWLFSLRRHACSGGAPGSLSSCTPKKLGHAK